MTVPQEKDDIGNRQQIASQGIVSIRFLIIQKKKVPHQIMNITAFYYFENKICICDHFCPDGRSTWHLFSASGRRRYQGSLWWVLLPGPRVIGGPCGGSVCRPGSVTSGPSCVDGPTPVETTKSSIQCKRTRGQLGVKLLQRYLQEPESPHRFDLHWRNCFDCPKESRPPIRARSSSLKYPVLSWKETVAAHHTLKKTPWSLHQQVVLQAMSSAGWQKRRTMQGSQFLTCGGSGLTGRDSKSCPDAKHVVPHDLTSYEIDSLFDAASCSRHPALIWRAVLYSTTGLRPLHTRS